MPANNIIEYQGRPEEPRVPQDLKKNDMVYLIALLDYVLWNKKNVVCWSGDAVQS